MCHTENINMRRRAAENVNLTSLVVIMRIIAWFINMPKLNCLKLHSVDSYWEIQLSRAIKKIHNPANNKVSIPGTLH